MFIDNSKLYTMPATHPAVHMAVEQLQAWGAPQQVDFYDYIDNWGYPTHEVLFHTQTQVADYIAGLLTEPTQLMITYNDLRRRGMIDESVPKPDTSPKPKQPAQQQLVDDVIGAADPNRPGMFEPAPGTNPIPGTPSGSHTYNGIQYVAKQITTGMFGIIRWMPVY